MRLFIAIPLPAKIKAALVAQQEALRRQLAQERGIRWVSDEAMHLTLQFLGEVTPERVESILGALRQVIAGHSSSMALHLNSAGAFPNLRRPQALWCGVGGDLAALGALQQELSSLLQSLGFPPEQRPFNPHLTLGRVRRETTPIQQATIGNAIRTLAAPEPVAWIAEPPALFESVLVSGGAVYTQVTTATSRQ